MKHIKVTYGIITEESAENGDYEETGFENEEGIPCDPDKWDREDNLTAIDLAFDVLRKHGATESSSAHFHKGIWYTSCDEDYTTGEHTDYGYHLYEFSELEEQAIFNRIKAL